MTRFVIGSAIAAVTLALGGCYETATGVLDRGVETSIAPGIYRCINEKDREASVASVSAPARLASDDVVYVAMIDKDRYAVRAASLAADLFLLEARGDFSGAQHIFVQKQAADAFALLVADTRSTRSREQLTALAAKHNVTITFPNYGAPTIAGARDSQRAFLLAHTSAVLERTATCRRGP
jgi:hypothetical protein